MNNSEKNNDRKILGFILLMAVIIAILSYPLGVWGMVRFEIVWGLGCLILYQNSKT